MNEQVLEQQTNIKFCVKGNCKWNTCNALQGLWGRRYEKVKCLWV